MDISVYPPKVLEWHFKKDCFINVSVKNTLGFSFGLTPPDSYDTANSYFTVIPRYKIIRATDNEVLLNFELEVVYKIENNQVKPSEEFLFSIVENSIELSNAIL